MLNLTADISRILTRTRAIVRRYPDVLRQAANDTAVHLRDLTPAELDRQLDRPTKRVAKPSSFRIDKATPRNRGATLSAISQINAILRKLQFALPDDFNNRPIASDAFDRFGNIVSRAQLRPAAKAALFAKTTAGPNKTRIPRFFAGDLGRPGTPTGIWERYDKGRRVRLFALFEVRRQNRKTLSLLEVWRAEGRRQMFSRVFRLSFAFLTRPTSQLPRSLR